MQNVIDAMGWLPFCIAVAGALAVALMYGHMAASQIKRPPTADELAEFGNECLREAMDRAAKHDTRLYGKDPYRPHFSRKGKAGRNG